MEPLNGEIKKILIEKLLVDVQYQRALKTPRVEAMKKDFQPLLIGVPEVSKRSDGSFFVLDGQHRIALLRSLGYKEVRCHVHEGLSVEKEAYFFRYYNRKREQISAFEDYRAALVERERKHLLIERAVTERGLRVAGYTSPVTISAVWQLRKMVGYGSGSDTGSSERLERVLDLILAAWPEEDNRFEGEVMDAVFWMIRKYPHLEDKRAVKRWGLKWTPRRLLEAGHVHKYTFRESKVKGMVIQLTKSYDDGLRVANKLHPKTEELMAA